MLTAGELAQMQAIQEESMIDTCVIVTITTTTGAYGGQTQTPSDSQPLRCGLSFNTAAGGGTARRINTERGPLAAVDAVLRLPLGTTLDATSQIRITHRNGAAVTPVTYQVEGPVMPGRTCLIVGLKRVGV